MNDNKFKKTKICKYWKNNKCRFMDNSLSCPYAHGSNELCQIQCENLNNDSDNNYENEKKEIIENLYYDQYSDEIHFYDEKTDLYTKDKYVKEMEELIKLIKDEDIKIPNILWELQINQIKTLKKTFKNYILD